MLTSEVLEKFQTELDSLGNKVREITGKAVALSKNTNTVKMRNGMPSNRLANSVDLFRNKVIEHEQALNILQKKVDHLHTLVRIYEEDPEAQNRL